MRTNSSAPSFESNIVRIASRSSAFETEMYFCLGTWIPLIAFSSPSPLTSSSFSLTSESKFLPFRERLSVLNWCFSRLMCNTVEGLRGERKKRGGFERRGGLVKRFGWPRGLKENIIESREKEREREHQL